MGKVNPEPHSCFMNTNLGVSESAPAAPAKEFQLLKRMQLVP